MEQKVDLMFQLIQEYEQSKNIEATRTFKPIPSNTMQMGGSVARDDLISVSDDDDDERDTDSEEVSDNEDEEEEEEEEEEALLRIQEPVENVKTISLSGAEIESLAVEPADDLDEISDLEEEPVDEITLEETNVDDIEDETDEEIAEDNNDEPVTVKKIEVNNEKPLDKMTVKELKAKAEKDGFTNFKGLRKDKLVELLTSQ